MRSSLFFLLELFRLKAGQLSFTAQQVSVSPECSSWDQREVTCTRAGCIERDDWVWEAPQLILPSTFLELEQTGFMDVRHDSYLKLSPCSETCEFLAMVLILCGAGREGQRSGEHVCIHHLAKPPGSTEKELLTGLPQVPELGLQKLLISANSLNFFGKKMVPNYSLVFSLNYILEWIFICKKYFLTKRGKIISAPHNYSFILLYKLPDFFCLFCLTIETFKYVFVCMWFPNC